MVLRTRTKIRIASILSRICRRARQIRGKNPSFAEVCRRGVRWELDLREGIELAIYLGLYERSTWGVLKHLIQPGDVIFDIGANIGAYTLPAAKQVGPSGHIHAFEPTEYAFHRLQRNVSLNPEFASCVSPAQVMLNDVDGEGLVDAICSSWPLEEKSTIHPHHRGQEMATAGARPETLDRYVECAKIQRVDLIKLDVDGFECHVLNGATQTLAKWKPTIVMELAPYLLEEHGRTLEEMVDTFLRCGYRLFRLHRTGNDELPMNADMLHAMVPVGKSINVLAKAQ